MQRRRCLYCGKYIEKNVTGKTAVYCCTTHKELYRARLLKSYNEEIDPVRTTGQ